MTAVPTDQPSLEFCRRLLAGRIPEEAITFCAYLLPDRAAIWWGHECLGHLTELLEEQDLETLALIQDWVGEPGNASRRAAVAEAAIARQQTPAGWIALAVQRHVSEGTQKRQYRLLDAIYSTAARNNVPSGIIGEAIMPSTPAFWPDWRGLR